MINASVRPSPKGWANQSIFSTPVSNAANSLKYHIGRTYGDAKDVVVMPEDDESCKVIQVSYEDKQKSFNQFIQRNQLLSAKKDKREKLL